MHTLLYPFKCTYVSPSSIVLRCLSYQLRLMLGLTGLPWQPYLSHCVASQSQWACPKDTNRHTHRHKHTQTHMQIVNVLSIQLPPLSSVLSNTHTHTHAHTCTHTHAHIHALNAPGFLSPVENTALAVFVCESERD